MEAVGLIVALVLGGGGVVGAVVNWLTVRNKQARESNLDFWDSYERQAASAEKRGDDAESTRVRREYEEQLEAYRVQQQLKQLLPPTTRIGPP